MPTIAVAALQQLVATVFTRLGLAVADADIMAATVVGAERDGARSHGLQRLPGYVTSVRSGWIDPHAEPVVIQTRPGVLAVDGANGFAQVALSRCRARLMDMARQLGTAVLAARNTHHFAALWPDVEPFAEQGFIALATVTSRPWITAWGGQRRALGTNPLAFACPVQGGRPLVWDQASSVMSQGDILLHRAAGQALPPGRGVDRAGMPTTDPAAVLDGGALLPIGDAKGASIAAMAEVLVAAFGGARLGEEDGAAAIPGATTSRTGQFLLLIDPAAAGRDDAASRTAALLDIIRASGSPRRPGERRYAARARAERDGIAVSDAMLAEVRHLAGVEPGR